MDLIMEHFPKVIMLAALFWACVVAAIVGGIVAICGGPWLAVSLTILFIVPVAVLVLISALA